MPKKHPDMSIQKLFFSSLLTNLNIIVKIRYILVPDEIHEVLNEPSPADFALLNSEKSAGGLVFILTKLTARYNLSHACVQETC